MRTYIHNDYEYHQDDYEAFEDRLYPYRYDDEDDEIEVEQSDDDWMWEPHAGLLEPGY